MMKTLVSARIGLKVVRIEKGKEVFKYLSPQKSCKKV